MTTLNNTGTGTLTIGTIVPDKVSLNTGASTPAWAAGQMFWDAADGTVTIDTEITSVRQQVGQELYLKARNNTGSTIVNGSVVYISGATGNRPTIALAQGNSAATADKVIGVTTHDIVNNAEGLVTTQGLVRDLNLSAFTDGDTVYVSPTTPGTFTATKPTAPNYAIHVGHILRAHGSLGVLLVSVENRAEVFGAITATSVNKVAITQPATAATLTLADGSTLATSGAFSATLTSTGATNVTLPTTGTLSTLAGTETLTNKKIGNHSETFTSPTISAGTLTLNLANSNIFNVALNANVTTLSITNVTASAAVSFTLILTADGTPRTITWPGSILWPGGTAPTLTSTNGKRDMIVFVTTDTGTTWLATVAGQNF
jgi:hypothetical protein